MPTNKVEIVLRMHYSTANAFVHWIVFRTFVRTSIVLICPYKYYTWATEHTHVPFILCSFDFVSFFHFLKFYLRSILCRRISVEMIFSLSPDSQRSHTASKIIVCWVCVCRTMLCLMQGAKEPKVNRFKTIEYRLCILSVLVPAAQLCLRAIQDSNNQKYANAMRERFNHPKHGKYTIYTPSIVHIRSKVVKMPFASPVLRWQNNDDVPNYKQKIEKQKDE